MKAKRPTTRTRKQVSASPFHEVGNVDATPDHVRDAALATLADRDALDLAEMLGLDTPTHIIRLDRARAVSRRSKGIGATA